MGVLARCFSISWSPRGVCLLGLVGMLALVACGSGSDPDSGAYKAAPETDRLVGRLDSGSSLTAPVIDRLFLTPNSPVPGTLVRAQVQTRAVDSRVLTLSYVWRVDGRRVETTGPALRLAEDTRGSLVEVMVIARDRQRESRAVRASVRVGNRVPELRGVAVEPMRRVTAEDGLIASAEGYDPDGDVLRYRYQWFINGSLVEADGPLLPVGRMVRGDLVAVSAVASDGDSDSAARRSRVVRVQNVPPRIDSEPGAIGSDGVFRYRPRVSDSDGDRFFAYELLQAPKGMKIDLVDGRIEWRPSDSQSGAHQVVLRVGDRNGDTATQTFRIDVSFLEFTVVDGS
jgi:hypothetical protein